jgi:hypothetical protein
VVFSFLKGLGGPEGGYRAIQASYDKHYKLALNQGIEPVSMGLFGALSSRYKLRRKFISDFVHMVEIAPFRLMGADIRVARLADYLMIDEIPDRINATGVWISINEAIRASSAGEDTGAYDLMVSSMPVLVNAPIRWVEWLDGDNRESLSQAFLSETSEEQN